MSYKRIEILGLRGFGTKQTLNFAQPNSQTGSGLTVIVGPNNSGKSTIYESFRAISSSRAPGFSSGQRNKNAENKVEISVTRTDESTLTLKTSKVSGGSETQFEPNLTEKTKLNFFTLPSRRAFSPFFSKDSWTRKIYTDQITLAPIRATQLEHFFRRLFKIQEEQETFDAFNTVLSKVHGTTPKWCIELSDTQQHYLKFENNGSSHNSDGVGEGILSLFTIIDALYDSNPGDLIFIDEPELSLHPSLQKKLAKLLLEYSSDRQIIISTHSPYFIDWESLENGGKIARTTVEEAGTIIYELNDETTKGILKLLNDHNNPHTLGLDAKEIFFLEDKVILVEGQEDVIFLTKILKLKSIELKGNFYGWGAGGADKTEKILNMLSDLGFKKVVTIFDKNKSHLIPDLQQKFQSYLFQSIPTDDVRDKKDKSIIGLIDYGGKNINTMHDKTIEVLFSSINDYLTEG